MNKFNSIAWMTLKGGIGCDIWNGYQDSRALAETTDIPFVEYEFNDVKFPVKFSGNIVNYSSMEEMADLFNKYISALNSSERDEVFSNKLLEAETNSQDNNRVPRM